MQKIAVIGLGYVGLPLAVEFGKVRPVLGFDINTARVAELQAGKDNTLEVTSQDLQDASQVEYTSDSTKLEECAIFIVTVPTPIDPANRPDLSPIIKASRTVGKAIKAGSLVIYESTVYPGCTEEVCVPILEECSGLKFNADFFCGYSPERINPGDKINTLTTIKKITSGSTPEIAEVVDELYKSIIKAGTWRASSLKVAEAAKVIENSQRDLNIAFVNELSVIFDRLGIDTTEVLEAAGSKWNFLPFRPGMVGGHCIGVDPYYLTHKAEEVGYHPQVILAGRRINDNMARYAARNVVRLMLKNGIDVARSTVGVMGITFKENCPDIRNSKVADLIKELQSWGVSVIVTDPWASVDEVKAEYGIRLGMIDAENKVDSLVVAVGHNEFRSLMLVEALAPFTGEAGLVRLPSLKCSGCTTGCGEGGAKRCLTGCTHGQYKFYAFVRPENLAPQWSRDRIIEAINAEGAPCYHGGCSEVYLEKAFDHTGWRPKQRLPVARELGETALMFLIHPTLTSAEMTKVCEAVSKVLIEATNG